MNKTQSKLWRLISSKQGTLFLQGSPGKGKTAIINSMAKELNMQVISVPVPAYENVDLGGFPITKDVDGIDMFYHAKPAWAHKANEKPTIVFFDEANRASTEVQNALMKIIYERKIDYDFSFNENVYFVLAGNYGSFGNKTDGTEVNDFDASFYNRLIRVDYDPVFDEWIEEYAKENVLSYIVNFLAGNTDLYWKREGDDPIYPSPRAWSRLSGHIKFHCKNLEIEEILQISDDFSSFVSFEAAERFISYLEDVKQLSIMDIVNNFDNIKDRMSALTKPQIKGFINQVDDKLMNSLNSKQIDNLAKFVKDYTTYDEKFALYDVIEEYYNPHDEKTIIKKDQFNAMFGSEFAKKLFESYGIDQEKI